MAAALACSKERGLDDELAQKVAEQLTEQDAVRAHARDELNIDIDDHPNPWHAAIASGVRCCAARPRFENAMFLWSL